jgi:enoyl-CoA hydratase/carnithine racemase
MGYKFLKLRHVNATLWVEIINPPVNFSTTSLVGELFFLIREVEKDPAIRVFILTGGIEDTYIRHFSIPELVQLTPDIKKLLLDRVFASKIVGRIFAYSTTMTNWLMDWFPGLERIILKLLKATSGYSSALYLWFMMHRLYLAIERMNKITIAAINGSVNGGGAEMSTCFDFRFMINDRDFTIGQLEVLLGILPGGGGSQRWPRIIGKAKALELMLRGNLIPPDEAERLGMITGSFKKDEFHAKIQEFADVMSKRPHVAVNGIKKAVHQGFETNLRHALSIELEESARCFTSPSTHKIMKCYNDYIRETIEAPNVKPTTIREAVTHLESEEFLKSLDV